VLCEGIEGEGVGFCVFAINKLRLPMLSSQAEGQNDSKTAGTR
jgi:hypothetical protein